MSRLVAGLTAALTAALLLGACVATDKEIVIAPQPLHLTQPPAYQVQGHLALDLRALHDGIVARHKSKSTGAEYHLAAASRRVLGDAAKTLFTETTEIAPKATKKYPIGHFDVIIQPKAKEIAVSTTNGTAVNVSMVFVLNYRSGTGKYLGFDTLLGEGSTYRSDAGQTEDTKRAIAAALEDMGRRFVEEVPKSKHLGG